VLIWSRVSANVWLLPPKDFWPMPAASLLPERISAKVFGQEELPGQYAKVGSVMHMLPVIAGGQMQQLQLPQWH